VTLPATTEGAWINTWGGHKIHLIDPDPNEIFIEDIAHSLSLLCRFGGNVSEFYSVAQHCAMVSTHMSGETDEPTQLLAGLLHDAAEAYLVDIPAPLKRIIPEYKVIEDRIERAIWTRFDIDMDSIDFNLIKHHDNRALATEAYHLIPNKHSEWYIPYLPYDLNELWAALIPERAEQVYLKMFMGLRALIVLGKQ
jgi:uncharacterized protein